jgi:hypothetical protein
LKDAESHIAQINALALIADLGVIARAAHDMVSTAGQRAKLCA